MLHPVPTSLLIAVLLSSNFSFLDLDPDLQPCPMLIVWLCAGAVLVHAPAGPVGPAGVPAGCPGDGGEVQESRGSALQAAHAHPPQATLYHSCRKLVWRIVLFVLWIQVRPGKGQRKFNFVGQGIICSPKNVTKPWK